ncbi:MAG: ComF family protein [Colwellia sp.]
MEWARLLKNLSLFEQRTIFKCKNYYLQFLHTFSCCDLCGNSVHEHALICSACLQDLPLFNQENIQGDLLNWPAINKALPNIYFDHLFCISPYLTPFTQWLPQFKYQGRFELASLFAELIVQQWDSRFITMPANVVLSVPLHHSKWQLRGYNQAHLIAKLFAKKRQLPYQASALIRVKKNNSQVGQTGAMRRANLQNNFALSPDFLSTLSLNKKHVLLIDDVVTTGSTASEISQLLKKSGVEKVTVIAVCLTLPKI